MFVTPPAAPLAGRRLIVSRRQSRTDDTVLQTVEPLDILSLAVYSSIVSVFVNTTRVS
jgi:hypothetical protein